jgi:hypothetical protein
MYGRDPRLPVDTLLANCNSDAEENIPAYISMHQKRLQDAYQLAKQKLGTAAARRKNYADKNAKPAPLYVGQRVLLRNRVAGRNKIQDAYKTAPYKVINVMDDKDVYQVELAMGTGNPKWVNRRDLKPIPVHQLQEQPRKVKRPDVRLNRDPYSSSTDSEDDFEVFVNRSTDDDQGQTLGNDQREDEYPSAPEFESSESDEIDPVPVRRSTRTTAGTHSNPYHDPRPAGNYRN